MTSWRCRSPATERGRLRARRWCWSPVQGCSAPTWSSRCSMGPSARTARCRDCSRSWTCPTWAQACWPRRCAWTRWPSRRSWATPASRRWATGPCAPPRPRTNASARRASWAFRFSSSPRGSGPRSASRRSPPPAELAPAVDAALEHDPLVIVEAMAAGLEVECSVLGNAAARASEPGEIVIDADWYDYDAKYRPGGMELVVPARISESARARVQELRRRGLPSGRCRRDGARGLLRGRGDRAGERAEHDPGLHLDERLRQVVRGLGRCLRRISSRSCCTWPLDRHADERGYRF